MKSRQVSFFLYWPVENAQLCINSIGHLGWLSGISNFPRFRKNVNSVELLKYISENSSRKGSFWCNKRKFDFSVLSSDSPYLEAVALNSLPGIQIIQTFNFQSLCLLFVWNWRFQKFETLNSYHNNSTKNIHSRHSISTQWTS